MTIREYTGFWQRHGCRTISGAGTFWYEVRPFVFICLPIGQMIAPTGWDLARMFWLSRAMVLRFPVRPRSANPPGGVYLCDRKDYDLNAVHPKARRQTRQALNNCSVERIEFHDLVDVGYRLNRETELRQGREETGMSRVRWARYCEAAGQTHDMEAWGAFVQRQLAGFVVCALVDRCYNFIHQSSSTAMLAQRPNNALAFTVTKSALGRTEVDSVCYGLRSVEDTESLEHFKLQMGFSIKALEERVLLHPLIRAGLALGGDRLIEFAGARWRGSDFWRKALAVSRVTRPTI